VSESGSEGNVNGGETGILTKGDNNAFDDLNLYLPGRTLVRRSEVMGCVVFYAPAVGWPAL